MDPVLISLNSESSLLILEQVLLMRSRNKGEVLRLEFDIGEQDIQNSAL